MNLFRVIFIAAIGLLLLSAESCASRTPDWYQVRVDDINEDTWFMTGISSATNNLFALRSLPHDTHGKSNVKETLLLRFKGAEGLKKIHLINTGSNISAQFVVNENELILQKYDSSNKNLQRRLLNYNFITHKDTQVGVYAHPKSRYPSYTLEHYNDSLYLIVTDLNKLSVNKITSSEPQLIHSLANVELVAKGFVNGVHTYVALTTAKQAYVLYKDTARFTRSTDFDWLGTAMELNPDPRKGCIKTRLAFAADIAAFQTREYLVLFDSQGKVSKINRIHVFDRSPSGRKRTRFEYEKIVADPLSIRSERIGLGAKAVGACQVLPLNEKQFLVFDRDYQRTLIFSHSQQ